MTTSQLGCHDHQLARPQFYVYRFPYVGKNNLIYGGGGGGIQVFTTKFATGGWVLEYRGLKHRH